MIRKSVNLSVEDERILAPFLDEGSAERDELQRFLPEGSVPESESQALIALARLGALVVRDRILERGYEELAAAERAARKPAKRGKR